jgi:Rieske Fe-S protein
MDGKVLGGPAPRPLDRYEVKVAGARIWLGPVEPSEATHS